MKLRRLVVNIFGTIGYMALAVQWTWLVVTLIAPLAVQPNVRDFFLPNTEQRLDKPATREQSLPPIVTTIILIASIIFAIGVTAYAVIAIPKTVGRTGQKITQAVAKRSLPIIAKNQPINHRQKNQLTRRLTWYVKAVAIAIPLLLLLVPPPDMLQLSHYVSVFFGGFMGVVALLAFGIQLVGAKLWRIDAKYIW